MAFEIIITPPPPPKKKKKLKKIFTSRDYNDSAHINNIMKLYII